MIKLIKSTFYKEKETKRKLTMFINQADQLSFGQECEKFEKKFAKWQNRKYCVFLNSGSSANLAIIQSFLNLGKIQRNDKIGFSALTWSTNAMPLIQLGLQPIPIDVEIDTLNISPQKFESVLEKHKLKALFITNLLGFCDNLSEIKNICIKKNILLFEDNCESLGSVFQNTKLGNFGIASTFSFYVGHHMSTIEGGAVCTDSESLTNMLRIVRAHGWDRNLSQKRQVKMRNKYKVNSTFYSRYTFYDLGYNLRPTEINGFIGNIQLHYLEEIIKKRNDNFNKIAPVLYRKQEFYPVRYNHMNFVSNFAIPIICKSRKIRDKLVDECNGKIEIRPIVAGDIVEQPFFTKYVKGSFENSNARLVHDQGLYFGNNPELTQKEIKEIISVFTKKLFL